MKLERSDKSPLIGANCVSGKPIDLTDYRGKKVLLSFFRDTICPYTNIWLEGLVQNESFYQEHNLEVVGIFNDTRSKVMDTIDNLKVNFPVIADESLNLYSEFGIETSKFGRVRSFSKLSNIKKLWNYKGIKGKSKTSILPAEFLVDEEGFIFKSHYGKDYADHMRTKDIINWIKK